MAEREPELPPRLFRKMRHALFQKFRKDIDELFH